MITRIVRAAHGTVDTTSFEAKCGPVIQQKEVQSEPGIAFPATAAVIPECESIVARIQMAVCVNKAGGLKCAKLFATDRIGQSAVVVALGLVEVARCDGKLKSPARITGAPVWVSSAARAMRRSIQATLWSYFGLGIGLPLGT